jgi:4-amino-4-deoxy-L-arabinose transferase-like glycosyltransferase
LFNVKPSFTRFALIAVWIAFLCKGVFYAGLIPIWEGYDEWVHFAFIQHVAVHNELPLPDTRISLELERSLELAPLAWELRDFLPPPHVTHDLFWKLPADERSRREQDLLAIPRNWQTQSGTTPLYEGKQAPLYYLLVSPLYNVIGNMSLPNRVFILRLVNILLGSLVIPIAFSVAQTVFADVRAGIVVCALIASMPELYMDAFRVGNPSLAMVLHSLFTLFCLRSVEGKLKYLPLAGMTLGLLVITRVHGLAAIPTMLLVVIYVSRQAKTYGRPRVLWLNAAAFTAPVLIAAWWYIRNVRLVGTPIWYDASPSHPMHLAEIARRAWNVRWRSGFESLFGSHIWFGNWSFLSVRSWMYRVFQCAWLLAAVGLFTRSWKKLTQIIPGKPTNDSTEAKHLSILLAIYGGFVLALTYHILMNSINLGVDASAGWYMYAVVIAEGTLIVAGLLAFRWGKAVVIGLIACFVLLEMYATHFVLIPYYTGLIAHAPDGGLQSFHLSQLNTIGFAEILARLQTNKVSFMTSQVIIGLWSLFLAASVSLPFVAARAFRAPKT